jgi:hypothetical protein
MLVAPFEIVHDALAGWYLKPLDDSGALVMFVFPVFMPVSCTCLHTV